MPPHRLAYRPVVMGTRGAVTSAHPLASMAGTRMLLEGGNAVDAAVAVGSTLNIVEPFMSGAGGIGLMVISRATTGERHVLDFIGRAPAAADPARATEDELAGGPKSCATPGNLGGWLTALARFGSMPAARVLGPAIEAAEHGVPLTWMNTQFFEQARATLGRSAEAQRLYLGNGAPRPGKVVTYKELAATFRQVAEGGADAFYRGPIARAIARAVAEAGGWLSEADMAAFSAEWREPVTITYRGREVCSVPPPFSAFQMLETLNILEGHDVAAWGHNSADYLHHLIEAVKLASADRLAYAYSPDVPIRGLVSKAYAASQRARIDAARAAVSEGERHSRERLAGQIGEGHPANFMHEQTTHFACADAQGTVASVTQTLGVPFGSGFAVPGTGLVLNNILKWMDRDPESPNVLRPGKKAGTMMSPTQVFTDGAFSLSIGTPGSYGILQTTTQMLLNLLEFGMNIQEAIEAPRVRVYRDRLVDAEGRVSAETRQALAGRGHEINVIEDWSWIVGGGQGIARDPESGALMAGADPRRDGYALAI
ncbi:MAG: gamma-glutamyltransferase [Candidatus Rokubacteria bacterium GWC2_70_24]|nr:MAG: gamma-glutamyltransferase [Candidatus Rokubacteria bacterium GWA2_70_23]OGK93298.1 MAG: gamma-glutamyltransferase [Candidatus Rokubacteria bacterium GWC2_70_24]OGK94753.1 MAG: gamma-glutamyltransferase [Candidatus Rokubacteria bacterium GWF2_70_14]